MSLDKYVHSKVENEILNNKNVVKVITEKKLEKNNFVRAINFFRNIKFNKNFSSWRYYK